MINNKTFLIINLISLLILSSFTDGEVIINEDNFILKKDLLFTNYTQNDTTYYQDSVRVYQWPKIAENLKLLDKLRNENSQWGFLSNYKNRNGEAPITDKYIKNKYNKYADTLGVERYQAIPLYYSNDTVKPVIYGRDGILIRILDSLNNYFYIEPILNSHDWLVQKKYVKTINQIDFDKVIFVDRTNQNITTIEKQDSLWLIRSMNPATTGVNRPPYMAQTPLGLFLIQEQKNRMIFLVDGTSREAGFSPYASRFTNGTYIHGVPTNYPSKKIIEYSQTLGTIPRSHMCVRNATSHAKFIYDWAEPLRSLVFIIE